MVAALDLPNDNCWSDVQKENRTDLGSWRHSESSAWLAEN